MPSYADSVLDRAPLPRLFDGALAALVTAIGVAEIWLPFSSVQGDGSRATSTLVVLILGLSLALRRVMPLGTALVVLFTWPVIFTFTPLLVLFWGQFVPIMIAVFSVARYGRGREPWYGALAGAATLLFMDLRVEVLQTPGEIVFHWGVFVIAWWFGWGQRAMERRAQESMQRAIDVEVAAAENTMAAIVEERTRIAREPHDVVAHSVSMMVVQAGADALTEMRRLVAMLRDSEESAALAPQPGIEALPDLIADARLSGLEVSLMVEGPQRSLPVGLDLAAYRIIQEALTNVRRHAVASRVQMLLRYGDDDVQIEVHDDGMGATASGVYGHGLIGMRERAELYGGRLETDSASGQGFTVRAVLPVATP